MAGRKIQGGLGGAYSISKTNPKFRFPGHHSENTKGRQGTAHGGRAGEAKKGRMGGRTRFTRDL